MEIATQLPTLPVSTEPEVSYKPIANPYIVGNPIKSRQMFFGREDDFEFLRQRLGRNGRSQIVVLHGERRCGKTSILFQIHNRALGSEFLTALVDMQTMAGLQSDGEFLDRLAREIVHALPPGELDLNEYDFFSQDISPYQTFSDLIADIQILHPYETILVLLDEYELLDTRVQEGTLTASFIRFLAGIVDHDKNISFIFTGSRRLEEQSAHAWQFLFGKAIYRNISFLSQQDTQRLITDPVRGYVQYPQDVVNQIYQLTAGHPFFTQVICQNTIDLLNEQRLSLINMIVLNQVVEEIVENPLPQMIYFWNELNSDQKMMLSLLSEFSPQNLPRSAPELKKLASKDPYRMKVETDALHLALESLYTARVLLKESTGYRFMLGLMSLWIRQDHSIWQVVKEIGRKGKAGRGRYFLHQVPVKKIIETATRVTQPIGSSVFLISCLLILAAVGFSFIGQTTKTTQKTTNTYDLALVSWTSPSEELVDLEPAKTQTAVLPERSNRSYFNMSRTKPAADSAVTEKVQEGGPESTVEESKNQIRQQALDAQQTAESLRPDVPVGIVDETVQRYYAAATRLYARGNNFLERGTYHEALGHFEQARILYQSTRDRLAYVNTQLHERCSTLIKEFQDRVSTKPVFSDLALYQASDASFAQGQKLFGRGDFSTAVTALEKSVQQVDSAAALHKIRENAIRTTLTAFFDAIRLKNVTAMQSVFPSLPGTKSKRWATFFESVGDIHMNALPRNTQFRDKKCIADYAVQLRFDGAAGGDDWQGWRLALQTDEDQWVIYNISERPSSGENR